MKTRLLLIVFGVIICLSALMMALGTYAQAESTVDIRDDELVLMSQMGGGLYEDILVAEGYTYVATASEVIIFSQVDPARLMKVGQFDARVQQLLDIRGHYLFVWGVAGVEIWNVYDPATPFLDDSLYLVENNVTVSGNYLYGSYSACGMQGCSGETVFQYNLTNPLNMSKLAVAQAYCMRDFQVTDQSLYYLNCDNAVYHLDLPENYANQKDGATQTVAINNVCELLLAWENYLFYQDCDGNFSALDYSNPNVPVNTILAANTTVSQIEGAGSYVYWHVYDEIDGESHFNQVELVDLTPVNSIDISGKIKDWQVVGGIAYILTETGEVHILSVTAPSSINVITEYNLIESSWERLVFWENLLYLLSDNSLFLLDVLDPNTSMPVDVFVDTLNQPVRIVAMAQVENYIYAVDRAHGNEWGGLYAIDVSDRAKPIIEDFFPMPESAIIFNTRDVAVVDEYALIVEVANNGILGIPFEPVLSVVDISQPSNMTEVYTMSLTAVATVIEIAGEYAYTAGYQGLQIIDVSTPMTPELIGFSSEVTDAIDIAVVGEYAYLVSDDYQFHVFDVSDPTQPFKIGQHDTPGEIKSIVINDQYAYFADGVAGISIYDIIDPAQPQFITSFGQPFPLSIEVSGKYLYAVGYSSSDLFMYNLSDINNPILMETYVVNDYAEVFVFGSDIYVTDENNRLFLLEYTGFSNISGQTFDVNGVPVPDVVMNIERDIQTVTDEGGGYAFQGLISGTYTITPTLTGATFWPLTHTVSVPEDAIEQNFTLLAEPVTAVLTPNTRATLMYTDTQGLLTTLVFPSGAVSTTTSITLTPQVIQNRSGYSWAKHGFSLTGAQNGQVLPELTFATAVSMTIAYSETDVALIVNGDLSLWSFLENEWQTNGTGCGTAVQDKIQNSILTSICKTGTYALYGETARVYFPTIANQHNNYGEYLVWLGFDEEIGVNHFSDASGHGYDGLCVGDQCPMIDMGETAVYFDGVNDYIYLGNPHDLAIGNEIILSAKVKVEATNGIRNIIAHGYDVWSKGEVALRVQDGMYEVGYWDGNDHFVSYPIPAEDIGQWVDLRGVYDGFSWRLYRNGVEVAMVEDSIGAVFVNGVWAIGAHGNGNERFFKGGIAEVYISIPK